MIDVVGCEWNVDCQMQKRVVDWLRQHTAYNDTMTQTTLSARVEFEQISPTSSGPHPVHWLSAGR